ncbi:hypothetical protein C1646_753236 [Rhizophagus diaphanus]|nr:hypothetical protein C1646_753236 [Rhizophagus diaphanus] [Rhizophagus sp. MUCL 43196]
MSNTVPSIGKHLSECENFKITYPDEINYVKENIETEDDHSFGQGVKIQTTINQFIGRKILPNEIPIFHRLLLRMTISNGWAFHGNRENIEAAIKQINEFLVDIKAKDVKINIVITDSASSYNAAQLRRVHQDIVFLPYFMHQANLCVADIFKSLPKFLETFKKATTIVKYFNASLKFTKDFQANSNKIMSNAIILIINDSDFWLNLTELEQILYPFCVALNILQRDKARLYDVLHSFGYFMQCTLESNDENYKEIMTIRLVNR